MKTKAVPGAARYFGATSTDLKFYVFMAPISDTGEFESAHAISKPLKTLQAAIDAAEKWQIKENAAVTKAAKKAK
jgi:hypothetical protein